MMTNGGDEDRVSICKGFRPERRRSASVVGMVKSSCACRWMGQAAAHEPPPADRRTRQNERNCTKCLTPQEGR